MLKTLNNSLIVIDITQWDTAVLGGNSEIAIKNWLKAKDTVFSQYKINQRCLQNNQ